MDMSRCEHGIDAGAWVLGALDEREAAAYEEHLRTCEECRAEVARLQVSADALALATEQIPPPPELKNRIMGAIEVDQPAPRRAPRRARRWFLRPLPVAGLAAAALAVGVAVGALVSGDSTRTVQAQVAQPGASATVHVTGDHARLEVSGMRNPPSGHVYEVWVQRGKHAPEPAGALFTVMNGRGGVDVGSVKGVDTIMVTSEPQGGSQQPTGKPVITAAV
jgi:anti-sigma-K factor RskA